MPMPSLPAWLDRYRMLPKRVFLFAAGQFLIHLITTAQFLLLNLFLKEKGLDDPSIAVLSSQRFVAALVLALPAGLWLRGRPLRMPMLVSAVMFPLAALAALEAVRFGMFDAASWLFLAMGAAGLLLNVGSLPMMLRLAPAKHSSEALSLLFVTWAAASICAAVVSSALQTIGGITLGGRYIGFDEYSTLLLLSIAACAAPLFYMRLPDPVPRRTALRHWLHVHREDWPVLARALTPTLCTAVAAGLSIQFLNLFFSHVHNLSAAAYSGYGAVSNVLVLFGGLLVPEIKRRFGWRGAIIGVKLIAVALLVIMALTELGGTAVWALPVAIACLILRQPLMSMANPSTNELTMNYVGERNRELMSACNGAIWSGSWWIAARIFGTLRAHDLAYWQIFLGTALLYLFGTVSYLFLIRATERKQTGAPQD